ncbi:hypothetical protein EC968_000383 [Mortierella alpina]|nr:hypothetical protein EC968_000383 [Mortierella alpina]
MNSGVDTMEILDIARHREHITFGLFRLASRVAREMLLIESHDRAQTVAQSLYLFHSQDRFAKRNALERLHADDRVMRNNAIESLLNQLRYLVQEFKLDFGVRFGRQRPSCITGTNFDSFAGKVPKEDVREQTAIQGPAKLLQNVDTVAYFNYLTTLPKAASSSMDIQLSRR